MERPFVYRDTGVNRFRCYRFYYHLLDTVSKSDFLHKKITPSDPNAIREEAEFVSFPLPPYFCVFRMFGFCELIVNNFVFY